jgi:hypothetical protein
LIDFKAEGAVIAEVWGIRSVKSNPKPVKGSDNKSKMAVARPKKVSAVGGKGLAKKTIKSRPRQPVALKNQQQLRRNAENPSGHRKYAKRISVFQ